MKLNALLDNIWLPNMAEDEELYVVLEKRLKLAESLLERCEKLGTHVDGVQKLQRKIKAEISFLSSLKDRKTPIKSSHIQSTNLSHLIGVVNASEDSKEVQSVITTFQSIWADSDGQEQSVCCIVDVVAGGGNVWIKVIARNPMALHRVWQGQGDYGEKDLVDQAEEFIECSKRHPVHFQTPLVSFRFCNGVTQSLATKLTEMGISVQGNIIPDPGEPDSSLSPLPVITHSGACINQANLDVSTMLAYVSAVTNGGAMYVFKDDIINSQAERERQEPLLPKLISYFEGKELFACTSAVADFKKILQTIGGPKEKERASLFLKRIHEVQDDPSERALSLKNSASIKFRSKIIFGTGDKMKAVTVTANSAFVRAALSQGVSFSVFTHESRALTEAKESKATPFTQS